ncbi:16S rRNA (cytidine(1402)-2'-O)-methyltransferase [Parerythrobacter aestuarii]|uniref:16S rRNA (cytidine(1402)-2'-O)-methyltransferase n=1 Tax=Parerythrobacter aestuarii TaxID=3020909 RepID=UPI0024DEAC26|nr:16S rRNA (cytidine(1402)-2'-O)-methyltransferase [Parerythrobacter aestuarii]
MSKKTENSSVRLHAHGHPNIKATHARTFEFVPETDLSASGTCIIGVAATGNREELLELRGEVRIELVCGDFRDIVHARVNPFYITSDPLIIRTNSQFQHRSLFVDADKGAAALDRDLVAALRLPGAELEILVNETGGDRCGALFVVGMPIGNVSDMSPRAIATLESADLILAEDTRSAKNVLGSVRANIVSFHAHNEAQRTDMAMAALEDGRRVALISEAGMPMLSDPGYPLLCAAIDADIAIAPVPGPSSIGTALSIAGLPTNDFRFMGFLPTKAGARERTLKKLREAEHTTVVFEAPHRLKETLHHIAQLLANRRLAVCRNLTKPGESVLRGTAQEMLDEVATWPTVSGEYTIVIAPGEPVQEIDLPDDLARMATSLLADGVSTKTIANALSAASGAKPRDMFQAVLAIKHALEDSDGSAGT